MEPRRTGELLVSEGYINLVQLRESLAALRQRGEGGELGAFLVDQGLITPRELALVLGKQFHLDVVDLDRVSPDSSALELVSRDLAERLGVLPLSIENGQLAVAVSNPLDFGVPKALASETRMRVNIMLAPLGEIREGIKEAYGHSEPAEDLPKLEPLSSGFVEARALFNPGHGGGLPGMERVPRLLQRAKEEGAQSIIFEPGRRGLVVKVRDRIGQRVLTSIAPASVDCFMSELWETLGTAPGEGRGAVTVMAQPQIGAEVMRLQVQALSTLRGCRVVLTLEGGAAQAIPLLSRPVTRSNMERIREVLAGPGGGLLLVITPSGESALPILTGLGLELGLDERDQVLIEPGSPGLMEGFIQVAVGAELPFDEAVLAAARQAPDVIHISDLRDGATASAALEAAQAGVKVFAGLHGDNPIEALEVLMEMGIDNGVLARGILGVVVARRVPKICGACRREVEPSLRDLAALELDAFRGRVTLYGGAGCPLCDGTGIRGEVGLEAVLPIVKGERAAFARGEVPWALVERIRDGLTYDAGAKVIGGYASPSHALGVLRGS